MFTWLFKLFGDTLLWMFTSKSGCLSSLAAIPFLIAVNIVKNVTGVSNNLAFFFVFVYVLFAVFIGGMIWFAWKKPKDFVAMLLVALIVVVATLALNSCREAGIEAERFR